jgi:hypothetical protein
LCSDRQFQNHIVIGIGEAGPPQEINCLKVRQGAQIVKHDFHLGIAQTQHRVIALSTSSYSNSNGVDSAIRTLPSAIALSNWSDFPLAE